MLYQFYWDDLIPIFTIGALLITAIYHINLFYFNRIQLLGNYSLYLWISLFFLLQATGTLNGKIDKTPILPYILCTSTLWSSYLIYLNFIVSTLRLRNKNQSFLITYTRKNWIIFPLCVFVHAAKYIVPVEMEQATSILAFVFDSGILLSSIMIIFTLYKEKRDVFNSYILWGAVCTVFFNTFTAFSVYNGGHLFNFTSLTFISLGYFVQIIFFSLAISYKMKIDTEEKYAALESASIKTIALEAEKKKASEILLTHDFNLKNERTKAVTEQRVIIGRKLHDDLSGSLVSLRYLISDYKRRATTENERKGFHEVELEVESLYVQTRNYSHQLSSPLKTSEDRLSYNLSEYLNKIETQFLESGLLRIYTQFNDFEIATRLSANQSQHVYFWLKECFVNTIKHAEASSIWIEIFFTQLDCVINFKDDGKGFELSEKTTGMGLTNLQSRTDELKGRLKIQSDFNCTELQLTFKANF
ncbi:sensor histidine kinase [Pedobacter paludis]|uniref:histidine kinase n=1 Tax=Pedobacter paludis TaxID=2203212 RepID=A0A317EXJ6_9SPHI|nr:7TM diverse intracellular signaling domain-containing protein [Pedobacter paludis]PWS30567.1 hypothetical protein DF947_16655 [Pedobacter paludis]